MAGALELFSISSLNITNCATVTLTQKNYILWKSQFESFLSGQGLLGFVDGSTHAPYATQNTTDINGSTSQRANPEYQRWYKADQSMEMEHILRFEKARKKGDNADVWFIANDQPDHIPAHKHFLAAASEFFRDMFTSTEPLPDKPINVPDMTKDELEAFLEFVYTCGNLSDLKLAQHALALYKAAHKYKISYLKGLCRDKLIANMEASNALDVLVEVADIHSDKILKDAVSEFMTTLERTADQVDVVRGEETSNDSLDNKGLPEQNQE